jgi:opacity protein-like surface antigen
VESIAIITAFLASLAAPDASADDELWEPSSYRTLASTPAEPDFESLALPATLADDETGKFSLGPAGGYLHARGADRGTWFVGAQARLRLINILAAEASITFHQNRYESGDVIVTQYPVTLSAMLYIIPAGPIRPYILGGVGWYYTQINYRGALGGIPDTREHFFGLHLGAGAELMVGKSVSLDVDGRYIFVNATEQQVINRQFNYWQVTFGLNFFF